MYLPFPLTLALMYLPNAPAEAVLPPALVEPVSALEAPVSGPSALADPLALSPAPAEDATGFHLSYTYIELGYFSTDVDAVNDTSDGYRLRGQLGLFERFYVFLEYAREDLDFDGGSADTDTYQLGAGVHLPVTSRIDAVGELSWVYDNLDSDIEDLDDSNNGWTAFAGGRALLFTTDRGGLEMNGGFRWLDYQSLLSDDQVGAWEVGGRFHFLNRFSVGVNYQFLEDDGRWGLDGRFSF